MWGSRAAAASRRLAVSAANLLAAVAPARRFPSPTWGAARGLAQLAYQEISAGQEYAMAGQQRTAVLAHGLLGSKRNWRSFSRGLAAELSDVTESPWTFFLVDLRNHGSTHGRPGFEPPHTLASSAADLIKFADEVVRPAGGHAPDAVIGHSLGGKVVLEYLHQMAQQTALELPSQAWVLDSIPGKVPVDSSGVPEVLEAVKGIPVPMPSRSWVDSYLKDNGYDLGLRQWLAQSLVAHSEHKTALDWQFDIRGASAMYHSYRETSFWNLLAKPPPQTEIHIVRAAESDRWTDENISQLDMASAASQEDASAGLTHHLELPNAGHWLHADNPTGLQQLMLSKMAKICD